MRCSCFYFMCFVACCLITSIANGQKHDTSWRPGEFRGLITGTSTSKDGVRVLGNPTWQGKPYEGPDEPGVEEWTYKITTPQGLCCNVFFRSGVADSITLETVEADESEAGRFFGGGFESVEYSLGDDPLETGSGPSCEDAKGPFTTLVNPKKGLSLWSDANGKVKEAMYSATNPIHQCGISRKTK